MSHGKGGGVTKKRDSYCKRVNHESTELVNCSIYVVVSEVFWEWTAFCHSTKSKELHFEFVINRRFIQSPFMFWSPGMGFI